jgi:hypothetical protein
MRREQYDFMICHVIEPRLIKGHEIVPDSDFLCPKYGQKGSGTFHPRSLLIFRQDRRNPSEMRLDKPEFLRESPIYRGFG